MDSLFDMSPEAGKRYAPLADRMRPRRLEDIVGQDAAVGRQSFLYRMIERDTIPSLLLFGPPGCGKTTIALVIAEMTKSCFIKVNATSSGIKEIRDVVSKAKEELSYYQRRTIVFIDEIHRFNKGQQDVLLPYVEDGTFILIGATTENPYFEINGPLLSRLRLIHLKRLTDEAIVSVLHRALNDEKYGLAIHRYTAKPEALSLIAAYASGDTRVALNLLEQSTSMLMDGGSLTEKEIADASLCDKNDRYQLIRHAVDIRVIQGYRLWKTNLMAYDIVKGTDRFVSNYTPEELAAFKEYVEKQLSTVEPELDRDELREIFLMIYANPVISKDSLSEN